MAKYCGFVGFVLNKEIVPGIWDEETVERRYFGDVLKNRVTNSDVNSSNTNVRITTNISIVVDPFVMNHYDAIKYAEYFGKKWKVVDYEIEYPRLTLMLGGLYNGNSNGAAQQVTDVHNECLLSAT